MDADEALNRLVESLDELLEEGRSVRSSLGELRTGGGAAPANASAPVREGFGDLVESVSGTLEHLRERLRQMDELLQSLRDSGQ